MQTRRPLKKVIPHLQNTFKSIDIRGVVGKQKVTGQWKCIFLKIRLTVDNKSKVQEMYRNKRKDLAFHNNKKFRLIANCRDIQQLDPTIKEIEKGQITIQRSSSKFLSSKLMHLSDQPVPTNDYNFSTAEEKSGYKHWFVITSYPTGSSTQKIIEDLGLSTDDIPVDNDLIAEWLDIAPEQWEKNFSNFVFVIPIYIKRIVLSKNENKVFATYEVHESLVNKCTLTKKFLMVSQKDLIHL
jgi:hypothetical protein